MTADERSPSLKAGEWFAMSTVDLANIHAAAAADKNHFWAGVLAAIAGFAIKDCGIEIVITLLRGTALALERGSHDH